MHVIYLFFLCVALFFLAYGLYLLLIPRIAARFSVWRFLYRLVRRKPTPPLSSRRAWIIRGEGAVLVAIAITWLINLHPQIRISSEPIFDPAVHQWRVENGDCSQDEAEVLAILNDTTKNLRANASMALCAGVVDGEKTYIVSVGRKNVDTNTPPDADTEFEIGSITKTMTCAVLASMIDEGAVKLEDSVNALLPDWNIPKHDTREITLKDLATHRSGLPRMPDTPLPGTYKNLLLFRVLDDPYANATPEYLREALAVQQLAKAPGADAEYSNFGMGLLGYALSQKAGLPYEKLIEQYVLHPLDMNDTGVILSADQSGRMAQGYLTPVSLGPFMLVFPMQPWNIGEGFQGAGCIKSTVRDMLKYVRAQIEAPEGPIGSALAATQQIQGEFMPGHKIGLGMVAMTREGVEEPVYWHNGGTSGFSSFMAFSKPHKVGIIMLATGQCDEDLGRAIIEAFVTRKSALQPMPG